MKVLVLCASDGYEALYIDGKLIDESSPLGEGETFMYLLRKSEEYGFRSTDVESKYLTEEDNEMLMDTGNFPDDINELIGDY